MNRFNLVAVCLCGIVMSTAIMMNGCSQMTTNKTNQVMIDDLNSQRKRIKDLEDKVEKQQQLLRVLILRGDAQTGWLKSIDKKLEKDNNR